MLGTMFKMCQNNVLTPKIPLGFWTKLGSLDIVGETIFLQKLNVRNEESNCRILKLPYGTSISKIYNMRSTRL
jgi:hypothetical protein